MSGCCNRPGIVADSAGRHLRDDRQIASEAAAGMTCRPTHSFLLDPSRPASRHVRDAGPNLGEDVAPVVMRRVFSRCRRTGGSGAVRRARRSDSAVSDVPAWN